MTQISNKLKVYSNEFFFTLISFFFLGKPRIPSVVFSLIHDGSFTHKNVPGKSKVRMARAWHYDNLDHCLKYFVLLDDVTPETGGATMIVSGSRKKSQQIINQGIKGNYATVEEANEAETKLKKLNIITEMNVKNLYGKKGDVFLLDTSNLHRGSHLNKGIKRSLWLYFQA